MNVDFKKLIASAERGRPEAQNALAVQFARGKSLQRNLTGALYWYLQAAKHGYAEAMWNAGSMLVGGEEAIPRNFKVGFRLIELAGEANQSSACLFLSDCYRHGTYGLNTNQEFSELWERRAWDYMNIQIFVKGIDVASEYGLEVTKPVAVPLLSRPTENRPPT